MSQIAHGWLRLRFLLLCFLATIFGGCTYSADPPSPQEAQQRREAFLRFEALSRQGQPTGLIQREPTYQAYDNNGNLIGTARPRSRWIQPNN